MRLLAVVFCFAVAMPAQQIDPDVGQGWLPASWFSAADSDPQAMHPLAEKDGPWLILATTFRGEAARDATI